MSSIPFDGFVWVPIATFVLIILLGALIGFISGWKTSLYFLGGNAILGISGIFIYGAIYDAIIKDVINDRLPENINLKPLLGNIEPYVGATIFFAIFLAINIILGILYIFLRKYLKIEKGETVNPSKIMKNRLIGLTLGSTTGFIIAVSASSSATAFFDPMSSDGKKSKFANFNSSVMKIMTLGQMYNSQNTQRLFAILNLVNNKDDGALGVFENMINNNGFNSGEGTTEDKIQKQVNNWNKDKEELKMVFGDSGMFEEALKAVPADNLHTEIKIDFFTENVVPIAKDLSPLNLGDDIQSIFAKFMNDNISVESNLDPSINNKDEIINFLSSSLLGDGQAEWK